MGIKSVGAPLTKIPFLETNTHFGRYVIEKELGRGSMGVVYKAYDPVIERPVAIKALKLDLDRKDLSGFRERFLTEAKSAGRLNHPNIVTVYDVGESDGTAYIAMEYLPGRELRRILAEASPYSFRQIAEIVQQIAEALAYAHDNGVIHRDIKPANIIIVRDTVPKVLDFGIAQLPAGTKNEEGAVIGSPRYMSPEQIQNKPLDGRSDIYSLGTVMYEMLAGRAPFEADTLASVVFQVLHEMPPPPQVYSRNTPHSLAKTVAKALAKNGADRFQDAEEMAEELRRYVMKAHAKATIGKRKTSADAFPSLIPVAMHGSPAAANELSKTVRLEAPAASESPPAARREALISPAALLLMSLGAVTVVLLGVGLTLLGKGNPTQVRPSSVTGVALPSSSAEGGDIQAPLAASAVLEPPAPLAESAVVAPPTADKPSPVPAAMKTAHAKTKAKRVEGMGDTGGAARARAGMAKGSLRLAIAPWGEIYVDGARAGVSPPLIQLQLPVGKHRIEIRNGDAAPFRTEVEVAVAEPKKIKYKFE